MVPSNGKHVMLSHDGSSSSREIVAKVHDILKAEHIPVWFDKDAGSNDHLYKRYGCPSRKKGNDIGFLSSMAEGVENASIVCCFITAEYQKADNCQCELRYAHARHIRIIPCMLADAKTWKPSEWLASVAASEAPVDFHDHSEEKLLLKVKELIGRIKEQAAIPAEQAKGEPTSYLLELVKHAFKRDHRVKATLDSCKSFPIEQSRVNLFVLEPIEYQGRGRTYMETRSSHMFIHGFKEIYAAKSPMDVKDMFLKGNKELKQILVFGGAGMGKSTFCRYAANQWANGAIWSQYKLVILLSLPHLTESRYPKLPLSARYTTFDVVHKEYFSSYSLSDKDKDSLREQLANSPVLWLLDGYDEIGQNLSPHLQELVADLRKNAHHILTSRPYTNTQSYDVQMELTGFTDEHILDYVNMFINGAHGEGEKESSESQDLVRLLKSNSRLWHLARTPMHLELICSLWGHVSWSETKQMTMTALYSKMTQWLCRRYLAKKSMHDKDMDAKKVYQNCETELAFLETLAFKAMQNNAIVLQSKLLEEVEQQTKYPFRAEPAFLNIGILLEGDEQYCFAHLSFQEYFAARHLIASLKGSADARQRAIDFIKGNKYDQRYGLMFTFASGLIFENDSEACLDTFWHTIQEKPVDLVGLRHLQLVMSCLAETPAEARPPQRAEMIDGIVKWMVYCLSTRYDRTRLFIHDCFRQNSSLIHEHAIMTRLIQLVSQVEDVQTRVKALEFISDLATFNLPGELIQPMVTAMRDGDIGVRVAACRALGLMDVEAAVTEEMLGVLIVALGDKEAWVHMKACKAIGRVGAKAATDPVISAMRQMFGAPHRRVDLAVWDAIRLMGVGARESMISKLLTDLEDKEKTVRYRACYGFIVMGESAARKEVISKLLTALGDEDPYVRKTACEAFASMGAEAATDAVISGLVQALKDDDAWVNEKALNALSRMGDKAATEEVTDAFVKAFDRRIYGLTEAALKALGVVAKRGEVSKLMNKLGAKFVDEDEDTRAKACELVGYMSGAPDLSEAIAKLLTAFGDPKFYVRLQVCQALGRLGSGAATGEVISLLVKALGDPESGVVLHACKALGLIGSKAAATDEVISKLVATLEHESSHVRLFACEALGRMGSKGATEEGISKLVASIGDEITETGLNACEALVRVGAEVATEQMTATLVTGLDHSDVKIRLKTCELIETLNSGVATDEVVNGLSLSGRSGNTVEAFHASEALQRILIPSVGVAELSIATVEDLCSFMTEDGLNKLKVVPSDQYVEGFLSSESTRLLPVVVAGAIVEGSAVTMTKNTIVVYGTEKTVSLEARSTLRDEIVQAFVRQAEALHLPSANISDAKIVSDQAKGPPARHAEEPTVSRACILS